MRYWQNILSALVLILSFNTVWSQNQRISGTVFNSVSQNALSGVNVKIEGTDRGAATDNQGYFVLNAIDTGHYTLVFSMVGFKPLKKEIAIDKGDKKSLTIALKPTSRELQSIEILGRKEQSYKVDHSFTATKVATPVEEIPQSISIISKELMEDQQTYKLGEVAKNISGVNQFSHYNDFTMRGFRGSARLINGLRAEQNPFSMPITPHLERIEVIKGPASALFANANPGGTINMVTKKPLESFRASASFTAGSFDTYRGNIDVSGPVDSNKQLLYRLNLGIENSGSFRDFQGNESYLVAPSISYFPTSSTELNVDIVYSRNESKLDRGQPIFNSEEGLGSTPISFTLSQPSDFYNVDNLQLSASLNQQITDWISFNASYMRFDVNTNLEEHRTSNQMRDESTIIMSFIKRKREFISNSLTTYLNSEFQTGDIAHNALLGFDYSNSSSDRFQWFSGLLRNEPNGTYPRDFNLNNPVYRSDNPVESYTRGGVREFGDPVKFNTKGFYIQDQLSFGNWKGLFSLRREMYEDVVPQNNNTLTSEQNTWLPRLGLVYETDFNTNFYGSYATGFQPVDANRNVPEFGGPFDPEKSRLYEVGAKGTFFSERLITTLAIYHIQKRNVLVNANDPDNAQLLDQRGEQQSQGVEVEMNGRINKNLSVSLNYAYNINEITASDNPEQVGRIAENAPRHMGGLWAKYKFLNSTLEGLEFSGGFNFVTERNTFEERLQLPGYVLFDLGASYEYENFRLGVNVNNIFDKKHWIGGYNFGRIFPGKPRHVIATLSYSFR